MIQTAFGTMEEEEAIAEVTGDAEFARKLIKEKNQLINPNARYRFMRTAYQCIFSIHHQDLLSLGY